MIRPPDPLVATPTLAVAPYGSAEAVRRLLHLAYRDCVTVLDLTYGAGRFWEAPLPPGIVLSKNVWTGTQAATRVSDSLWRYSVDFTDARPLDGKSFDLVAYDPPHVADAGAGGLYKARYGTAKGTAALRLLIEEGFLEARRLARLGVLVKLADHAHGGEWLHLTDWVNRVRGGYNQYTLGDAPFLYCALHTYRPSNTVDPKWTVQRVPRSNGATYLCFRLDSPKHRDFDREYARQEKARRTA